MPGKTQGITDMTVFHHGPTALRVLEGVFPYHSWQSDTPDNLAQHGATRGKIHVHFTDIGYAGVSG